MRSGAATEAEILAALQAARHKDFATCATQVGPHRDDLVFELEGREAGSYASQGQLRAIMLAWKTAELAVLARAHDGPPRRRTITVPAWAAAIRAARDRRPGTPRYRGR